MPEDNQLRPATAEEIEDSLAFTLRFDGRSRDGLPRPHSMPSCTSSAT